MNNQPFFPTAVTNDGDHNILAPNGVTPAPGESVSIPGATLRDWFAGQALAGMLAGYFQDIDPSGIMNGTSIPSRIASSAYAVADAMLAERAKK